MGRSGKLLALLVILSGASTAWFQILAEEAAFTRPDGLLVAAFFVSYVSVFITTIGLALSILQGWLGGPADRGEATTSAPTPWAIVVCLFGVIVLVSGRPKTDVEVTVTLPPSTVLPSDSN